MSKEQQALERIKNEFGCDPIYYGLAEEFIILERFIQENGDKNKIKTPTMIGYTVEYDTYDAYECPNCGDYFFDMSNFCPECGFKWRENE